MRVESASAPSPEFACGVLPEGWDVGGRYSEGQRVRRVTEQRKLSAPGSGGIACLNGNAVILFSGQLPMYHLPFLLAAGSARPQRQQVVWSLGLVFTSAT